MDILPRVVGYLSYVTSVSVHDENLRHPSANRNKSDLLAIGGPCGRIILSLAACELSHVTAMSSAVRIHDVHFHSAVTIGDENDLAAIRRPERLIIHDIGKGHSSAENHRGPKLKCPN